MVKKVKSRKKSKNELAIVITECSTKDVEAIEKEIKKTVRKWNRLLDNNLQYKATIILDSCNNHLEE